LIRITLKEIILINVLFKLPYVNGKASANTIINKSKSWKLLLNKSKLHAHKKHNFLNKLMKKNKVNYLRINIFPDGGISRIRVFGKAQ
jgi:allantoicase